MEFIFLALQRVFGRLLSKSVISGCHVNNIPLTISFK